MPHIAGNLGAEVEASTYVITSYLISNAIVLPLSAWLSSLFGRRNYYLMCLGVFTVSSFMCGIAPSLATLVLFRLLQGIGGGGLQPSTQAILIDTFPIHQRGMSMAIYGMTIMVAPILGPTLGGWITDNFSWRWVFLINVPVGIAAAALSWRLIVDPPHLVRRRGKNKYRIDFVGLGLICLGIGCAQIVLDFGERREWFDSNLITTCAVLAVVGLSAGVVWELRHKDPIVDLRLMADRNFGLCVFVMFIFGCGLYVSTALLPLYMQTLLGYDATTAGLAISPGGIVVMVMLPFIGMMATHLDPRKMIAFGMTVIGISLFLMGYFSPAIDFRTVMWSRVLQSFGLAFVFVPVNTLAYAYIDRRHRNAAAGIINLARNSGASLGIALASSMVTRQSQVHQATLTNHISATDPETVGTIAALTERFAASFGDPVRASLAAHEVVYEMVQQQARALAFVDIFRWAGPLMLIVVPFVMLMHRPPAIVGGPPPGR